MKYDNIFIYKIECEETKDTYINYTSKRNLYRAMRSLEQRKNKHPRLDTILNSQTSKATLLENGKYDNKAEVCMRIKELSKTNPNTINHIIDKRYNVTEDIRAYQKAYYKKYGKGRYYDKGVIKCPCGSVFSLRSLYGHVSCKRHINYIINGGDFTTVYSNSNSQD
jgi:hypothetical protein